jgi:Protein of unknown function (DUF3037)
MSLQRYSFCFLRYIHEPLSGEFANVGVLLWSPDSKFLGFRASRKFSRLSHFFHGYQQKDHRQLISRIETQFRKLSEELARSPMELLFEEVPDSARDLAIKVIPHDDAALQWSLSGGGLTESPQAELDTLFHEAIARHYDAVEDARRDDSLIYKEIYSRAFESPVVRPHVSTHEVKTKLASHVFPQAWKNGVWNVYQPISFDLKLAENIRNKAHRWESLARFLAQASEKPKIHFLLGAPSGEQRMEYGNAKDVLRSAGDVILIEEDEASDFARDLEGRIAAMAS